MRKVLGLLFFLVCTSLQAQQPDKLNSAEIFQEIKKLNFLGSVLYVAAHPDDENTRLISYLSNHLSARTAYLSLTRGDGGQNLIGPELREQLGVIRTQELLAARRIDGGEQYFTRANDFGYSKNPKETLNIWKEKEILKDVVKTIREFKPDIIINRFHAHSAGETHGHHTSSAILSTKAFELAVDSTAFPEQARRLGTWKPTKLFFNTSPWFYESQEAFEAADKSNFLEFDTGVYFPLKGMSNTEIASLSRSQHQSQGFGSTGTRGQTPEYIELISGQHPQSSDNLFAGINTTWSRIDGGLEIGRILKKVEENYDFKDPSKSIPGLLKAYSHILQLKNDHWRQIKSEEIRKIIVASAGLYLEAVSEEPSATPGEKISLNLEAINRSGINMKLLGVKILPSGDSIDLQNALENNVPWVEKVPVIIPDDLEYTSPYWLRKKGSLGMYAVEATDLIGLPETPREVQVDFLVQIQNHDAISFKRNVVYKKNDPVKGEMYQPFEIVPKISVTTADDVVIFANHAPKPISVTVKAMKDSVSGTVGIKPLASWKISPDSHSFGPLQKGEEVKFNFQVTAPDFQNTGLLEPVAQVDSEEYSEEIIQLDYAHIPMQTLVLPAETKLVKLDIKKRGNLIGYIEGAGDAVPKALEQIGYSVQKITPEDITSEALRKYDAVVLGIRAFNVEEALRYKQEALFQYVYNGGNLIVQYNTNRGLVTQDLAPFPLQISRDRVTDEEAEVRLLRKDHPVLNVPNKITSEDFEGWVQERGLYFPDEWAPQFTPVLSMNDPGENPKNGSLLIAPYGNGNYIYTGLSFFREFPAGVPGAFRLFANLLSLRNSTGTATESNHTN